MTVYTVFRNWLPLYGSWLLMTLEGPLVTAFINRMDNPPLNLAAFSLVMAISIFIESPIISILSTSTALVRNNASYYKVKKFNYYLIGLLTILMSVVSCTKLADYLIIDVMRAPAAVSAAAKQGLCIMIFWTAAIGFRRFLQGILIKAGKTSLIAYGTIVRLLFTAITAFIYKTYTQISGIEAAAAALMAGVTAEAAYTYAASYRTRNELLKVHNKHDEELSYRKIINFHIPLALTSMLVITAQPLINAFLVKSENPINSLAAWPIIFQLVLISRAGAIAYPEIVIAMYSSESRLAIKRFSLLLSFGFSLMFVLFIFTPAIDYYLNHVQNVPESVKEIVKKNLIYFIPVPLISGFSMWIKGIIIKSGQTRSVSLGTIVNIVFLSGVLYLSDYFNALPLQAAAAAMSISLLAELSVLAYAKTKVAGKL